jgi:hypothetical protein
VDFQEEGVLLGSLTDARLVHYLDNPAPEDEAWRVQLLSPIASQDQLPNSYWRVEFKDEREMIVIKHDPHQEVSEYLQDPKNPNWVVYLIDKNGTLESEDQSYRCSLPQ